MAIRSVSLDGCRPAPRLHGATDHGRLANAVVSNDRDDIVGSCDHGLMYQHAVGSGG